MSDIVLERGLSVLESCGCWCSQSIVDPYSILYIYTTVYCVLSYGSGFLPEKY
jgi:hypothetical protein